MPIQFFSLPWHMFQSENAQAAQNIFNQNAAAQSQVAGTQSQNRAAEAETLQTQETKPVEDTVIESDRRNARTFTQSREEKKPKPEEAPPPEKLPDPDGRGSILDVQG